MVIVIALSVVDRYDADVRRLFLLAKRNYVVKYCQKRVCLRVDYP